MATFNNKVSDTVIDGTSAADLITNSGARVTINGYGGNDTIQMDESEVAGQQYHNFIDAGDGNNYVNNGKVELSTISAGNGNDTIITGGGEKHHDVTRYDKYGNRGEITDYITSIAAGAGNNQISITSYISEGEIYAKDGNDQIFIASTDNSTINVGNGDNFVTLNGESSGNVIMAGKGNDNVSLFSSSHNNNISVGGGNNTVYGLGENQSIWAGDGADFVMVEKGGYANVGDGKNNVSLISSGNVSIIAGNNDDTINVDDNEVLGQQYHNIINAGGGNNYINNDKVELSTISTGDGNDTIITGGGEKHRDVNSYDKYGNRGSTTDYITSIAAGAGNNQISITGYMSRGNISAKDGNDTVLTASTDNSTINVGNGKNFVTLNGKGSGNVIAAGNGNDNISLSSSFSDNEISVGSGNNTVYGAGANQSVQASNDDNKITIGSGYVKVGDGKNNITVIEGGRSSIIAGKGNNIINFGDDSETGEQQYHNTIIVGNGNNHIKNTAELSTISAGTGNDTIITSGGEKHHDVSRYDKYGNRGESIDYITSIVAGAGNNQISITSYMTEGEIYAKDGNDRVSIESSSQSLINVGNGRNTVIADNDLNNSENTITAGKGSDLIRIGGNKNFINAGSGRNIISLTSGAENTIIAGKGNDTIALDEDAANNVIIFGGGNDLVLNYHENDTIKATGALAQKTKGDDVILTFGTNSMTLKGAADKAIQTDTLTSSEDAYKALNADKTTGETLAPDGKAIANDPTPYAVIVNTDSGASIEGTNKNELISNHASKVMISALGNNDSIHNTAAQVTIDAGKGNDYISNSGENVVFKYADGDGKDTIVGFNSTSTLQVGDTYTHKVSGNDVIVTVGKGSITLKNAKGKNLKYDGENIYESYSWTLDGTTATYKTSDNALVTVTGVKSTSGLSLSGKVVTISKAAVNGKPITISDGYTLALDKNVATPKTTKAWSLSKTTATYKQTTSAGYTLADNIITYSKKSTETLATVKGVKSTKGLSLKDNVITVSKSALGTDKVTVSDGYTLALGNDVTQSKATAEGWSFSKKTATYKTASTTAGYSCDGSTITYSKKKDASTLVTVTGVKSANGLSLSDNVVTVSKAALGTDKVTISKGYSLVLGGSVKQSSVKEDWNLNKTTATLNRTTSAGYSSDGSTITYDKKATETLATVSGVKSTSGLSVNGEVITLKNTALNKKVTVNGSGYEFNFASDYSKATITGSKNADNITSRGKNLSINGGAGADSINVLGSATSITGGAGDDTITSSGKNNIFVYADGDGNDVIADFSLNDKIKITKGTAKVTTDGSDVLVTVGKGSIKLTDAAGQIISIINSKGKEESYSTADAPFGNDYWFDENNFNTTVKLDSITKTSADVYPLDKLETSTALVKEKTLLTYSGKK